MALHELENGQILLLGEGDFSFTVAFIHQLQPNVKVTATCLLSSTHLRQLHPAAEENVDFLLSKGVKVIYEVDATKLQENEHLTSTLFERIIFNFPHVGGKSNIKKNRTLLKDFFASATRKMGGTPADEPVRDWPDSWQSVAVASYQDLVLREIWPFDIKEYPQYKSTGFRSLDRQFHTDGALTYVFCKCLPLPDPVAPPRFSEVYVDGAKYWIDSAYIASHGMRCLCSKKGHPVEIILSSILDAVKTATDVCVEVKQLTSATIRSPHDISQCYKLLPVTCDSEESLMNKAEDVHCFDSCDLNSSDEFISINATVPSSQTSDHRHRDMSKLYLRGTLLDSVTDELKPDTLHCCYGCVYRRLSFIDCFDLPMKNELLLMLSSSDIEASVTTMMDIIQRTLSVVLGDDYRVMMTQVSDDTEHLLPSHLMSSHLYTIFINGRSASQPATVACNQIQGTGKRAKPDQDSVKYSKSSRSTGYVGMTHHGRQVAILDLDILSMMRYHLPDVRSLWTQDTAILSQFCDLKPADAYRYKPISLYPPLWRHDISFWENPDLQFSERQLMDIIRDVGGDALKCVLLMNVWKDPTTGRRSRCYRQVYQSYEHAISHAFAHKLQNLVRLTLTDRLAVELR